MNSMTRSDNLRLRPDALDSGLTDYDIRRLLQSGRWTQIRRGAYLPGEPPCEVEQRHRLAIAATLPRLADGSAVSHISGAVMLGVPLWRLRPFPVHVTDRRQSGTNRRTLLHTHPAGPEFDTVTIDGVPVVCAARTVLDLARTLPFEDAVVAADGALRLELVTPEQLRDELDRAQGRHGARRAATVLKFADGRSESVGESRSRVALHRAGLAAPDLQVLVTNDAGITIARCDFGYPDLKVAGEFDGFVKYGRLLRPGEEPGDAVTREKVREDAIRDARWIVVRWIWDELGRPAAIAARIRRALERAASWR